MIDKKEISEIKRILEKEGYILKEVHNGMSQSFSIDKENNRVEYYGWEHHGTFKNSINIVFRVPHNFVMTSKLGELLASSIKNYIENEKDC